MQESKEMLAKLVKVDTKPYYEFHMFMCTNRRDNARSCGGDGSERLLNYAKRYVRALEDKITVDVRISSSGCMGRCAQGPTVVVYPEGAWYRCTSQSDVKEIIDRHLFDRELIERLRGTLTL